MQHKANTESLQNRIFLLLITAVSAGCILTHVWHAHTHVLEAESSGQTCSCREPGCHFREYTLLQLRLSGFLVDMPLPETGNAPWRGQGSPLCSDLGLSLPAPSAPPLASRHSPWVPRKRSAPSPLPTPVPTPPYLLGGPLHSLPGPAHPPEELPCPPAHLKLSCLFLDILSTPAPQSRSSAWCTHRCPPQAMHQNTKHRS